MTLHTTIGSGAGDLDFSPDGGLLALINSQGMIQVWRTTDWQQLWTAEHSGPYSQRLAFSPDGQRLATVNTASNVARLWETSTGNIIAEISHPDWKEGLYGVAFSPDGEFLAVGGQRKIIVASASSGLPLFDLTHDLTFLNELAFSPSGPWLAAKASNSWGPSRIVVWDIFTHEQRVLAEYNLPTSGNITFSPDANWFAGGMNAGALVWKTKIWPDPIQMESSERFRTNNNLAFSPNGRWLAGSSSSAEIRIWEVSTWQVVASMAQEEQEINIWDLDFSPDSQWLIAGLGDNVVGLGYNEAQLWSIPSGTLTARLPHATSVSNVAFSPDGQWIASSGREVRIWAFSP